MQVNPSIRSDIVKNLSSKSTGENAGWVRRKSGYRSAKKRNQPLIITASGTLVRIESDGYGVVEISPKKQGRSFAFFTERVKLVELKLNNLRQGLKIDVIAKDRGTDVFEIVAVKPRKDARNCTRNGDKATEGGIKISRHRLWY